MDIDLSAFHFLRPLWLLLLLPGLLLPLAWGRSRDLSRRLRGAIAPNLLKHLVITPSDRQRLRPVHLFGALLILGGLAAAGPTWEQDRPAFLENRAPLILAVDLSPSMDANDVPPTRLEAAKHKLHDLIQRRAGARTGLIAYAGSAHLVLPATEDPALLDSFLQALSTELIEAPGKNALAVIEEAKRLLAAEQSPGTLVLVTDGADVSQLEAIGKSLDNAGLQLLVLAVGSQDGGMLRDAQGQPRVDSTGRPLLANFDAQGLKQLADAADAPLGSLTLNDDDLDWIELHAQQHFQAASGDGQEVHWKDAGYWLCWPLLLIAFFCVRRGWSVNWLGGLLLALGLALPAPPAQAGVLADAFFTPDQQGRWAFEHGHYPQAQAHFHDPYWQGLAAYNAADYNAALASFARLDSAQAYFYLGNSYARLYKLPEAIAAFGQALKLQPQFPEASANLALVTELYQDQQEEGEKAPELKPDEEKFDNKTGKGKTEQMQAPKTPSDELWLRNLSTSPAKFLKQKFSLQDAARKASNGGQP
ncbi:VWA domain-containing protein [Pseudomonas cavernae]|uniref:VWA domain-containing protein n=1 Tax=Pseudomonas cavernae TaxID=2320867 RepID=A0A385Z5Y0_9PSED|nr:VWA domain-containing protein [Pseudomonas cavernae]AYC33058.1 VWA domain-containing protein [Pseudomonas cavernae]